MRTYLSVHPVIPNLLSHALQVKLNIQEKKHHKSRRYNFKCKLQNIATKWTTTYLNFDLLLSALCTKTKPCLDKDKKHNSFLWIYGIGKYTYLYTFPPITTTLIIQINEGRLIASVGN